MGGKKLYKLEFTVRARHLDPNRIKGRDWRNVHRRYEQVKRSVKSKVSGKVPIKPLTSFRISCLRRSAGALDYDNLIASLKPFIDGLTLSGIIKDDNWNYIRKIDVDQAKDKLPKGMFELDIIVEELPKKSKSKKIKDPCDEILKLMKTFSEALLDKNIPWVKEHLEKFTILSGDGDE